jgi:hypothetical protein
VDDRPRVGYQVVNMLGHTRICRAWSEYQGLYYDTQWGHLSSVRLPE